MRWRPDPYEQLEALRRLAVEHTEQLARIETQLSDNNHVTQRKLGKLMTNQEHLEEGVAAIGASIATAVQELKAQIADGTPAEDLASRLVKSLAASTAAEAAADAPAPPAE